jgi:hypothetical protein
MTNYLVTNNELQYETTIRRGRFEGPIHLAYSDCTEEHLLKVLLTLFLEGDTFDTRFGLFEIKNNEIKAVDSKNNLK